MKELEALELLKSQLEEAEALLARQRAELAVKEAELAELRLRQQQQTESDLRGIRWLVVHCPELASLDGDAIEIFLNRFAAGPRLVS